jgi:hypothetical protein
MSGRVLARPLDKKETQVLNESYKELLAYYTSAPGDASKLLNTGASTADPRLAKPRFAALTMVANEMLNLDETLEK